MRKIIRATSIAAIAAGAALILKIALDPIVSQAELPFVLFPAAVMVAAWYGGARAGILCTLLSALVSDFFFAFPHFDLRIQGITQGLTLLEFIAEGVVISVLAGALHRARKQTKSTLDQATQAQEASTKAMLEMHRAEEARELSELRFNSFVESNIIGVFVAEVDGAIVDANAAFLEMVGCTQSELEKCECNWREMTPAMYQSDDQRALEQIQENGSCEPYEKEFVRSDRKRVPALVGATTLPGGEQMICFAVDLSKQKFVERELAAAKETAEAASEAKSHFLANISHELRTPMNAILGMTKLALDDELSPLVRDYLETVKGSADTLLYLLNDLLDFSRMEAGTFDLDPEPFSVRDTLDDAAKALALRASEKGLELACYVHSEVPPWVEGDGRRLRQIITNLVGNAIKFTEVGEVVISATVEGLTGDIARIEFVVADTGVGISPEHQATIFAPFTQADASTTRKHTGTGLGLTISRQLVEKMGGTIRVSSVIDEGSKFFCSVPFQVVAAPNDKPVHSDPAAQLRDLPVLVVDDNATNRRILHAMLTNWSMNPMEVDSASRALEVLQEESGDGFPLVIVDALMPEMDGMTLVEEARKKGVLNSATVLMLSSADRQVFQERCEQLHINNFLEKPVSQSGLLDAIMTSLGDMRLDAPEQPIVSAATSTLKVLVAEDTPANQKVVAAILERRGHVVDIAQNGREAVDRLRQADYDVVLMDVQMPTMDGYQATRVIRELPDETKAGVPIVAMTAHAMKGDRERCFASGMDRYISKPIDATKLIRLVERSGKANKAPRQSTAEGNSSKDKNGSKQKAMKIEVDLQAALRRMGGDQELLRDMAKFFIEDAPGLVAELEKAVATRSKEQVTRTAHSLKGLAANFEANSLVKDAFELEQRGELGVWEDINDRLAAIRTGVQQLLDVLSKEFPHLH